MGFARDALSAFLPHLQKRCETIQLWSGFSSFSLVDSSVSRQLPTFRLKNRRTFARERIWVKVRHTGCPRSFLVEPSAYLPLLSRIFGPVPLILFQAMLDILYKQGRNPFLVSFFPFFLYDTY